MSRGYRVVWEIDVTADSPIEAAQKARAAQVDRSTQASYFEVDDDVELIRVDLDEEPCQTCNGERDFCQACGGVGTARAEADRMPLQRRGQTP
ncbi:hypothetical protein ACFY05_32895 [Microtetraspora fusca]|uniref:Zinc ribbon domain-containing protein n=1 Tax=Microtetraspora fusca TaxID=1997 RepID=A0ABW6VFE0_MICFU